MAFSNGKIVVAKKKIIIINKTYQIFFNSTKIKFIDNFFIIKFLKNVENLNILCNSQLNKVNIIDNPLLIKNFPRPYYLQWVWLSSHP